MRIRSIAIVTGAALVTLFAMPAALLGGAMLAQSYAPDTLRFAVHAATGVTEVGLEAPEVQTAWTSVRNTMDLNVVKTAIADEIGLPSSETQPAR
jgi:hypothetical protein